MQNLDPHSIPLASTHLIEASAGTGKSWTVTLLYLRLILEKNLTVDQILVVTFTEAATKELRNDIRNRLVEATLAFAQADYQKDDEYLKLIQSSDNKEQALSQLNRAKLSLDEAAIFTIHSFCKRALNENAFDTGLPFESELMDDDRELMQKLTDDFWRRRFEKAPKVLLLKLKNTKITPDTLLNDLWKHVGKPYLVNKGPLKTQISNETWVKLDQLFNDVMTMWEIDGCEISELLIANKNLNGNKYRVSTVEKNCSQFMKITSLSDITKDLLKVDLKRFKASSLVEGTNAKGETPTHPFFELWESFSDLWEQVETIIEGYISQIKIDLLDYLRKELPKEKQRLGLLSYDDLLLNLQQSIKARPELANDLCQKYPAALIDEFQDTDPIQYEIFNSIYSGSSNSAVFLVGDPKQAIYSFRGGDIDTYLFAKSNTLDSNHHTLKKNWRSHPDLIAAFNSLYAKRDNSFRDEGINYIEVEAGDKVNQDLLTPNEPSSLRFWQVQQSEEVKGVKQVRKAIANAVAGDIAELLNASNQGNAKIGDELIQGGDIAILIRSHSEGDLIKSALNDRGIASVQSSKNSIFETHEANELIVLLTAIVEPQREDNVRRALVTELIGKQAEDLLIFERDSNTWESQLLNMQNWHYQWKEQGFLPMMRELMHSENLHQHLLSFSDGERRITNILHLSELIHQQSQKLSLSMEEVLRWLRQKQMSSSQTESELRLESDEKLVKIVTIHKSKGLEYPIVYCPFVGISGKDNSDKIFSFHKDKENYLEIGSPDIEDHKTLRKAEESAEDTRLLYVALTRAKYQCTVVCSPESISGSPDKTALGWLLTDGKSIMPSKSKKAEKDKNDADFYESYNKRLELLSRNNGISLLALPKFSDSLCFKLTHVNQQLTARSFKAKIRSQAQVTSFSKLSAGAHKEEPDYDASSHSDKHLPAITENEFPRGATAGSCLHEMYENLDFTLSLDEQSELITGTLNKFSYDKKHQESAMMLIENSLKAELFKGFRLNQLTKDKRLDEMEFYLPLKQLQIEHLRQILLKHLPENWQVVRDAVSTLNFDQVQGYLKGFIDLIFEHNDQYYVVDYKSNTLTDYQTDKLLPVMADSHYYLQYLLYSVALHRYLKKRIENYSWQTHIGGVYYLFIRGMGEDAAAQSSNKGGGAFYNKPDYKLIDALDGLFEESLI
ncbi:MAG: exodeoxyribonuclease V subunit beta [Cocleimonas sp.]